MFDVGFWEVALIGVIALLVVGPEKLPGLARTVGTYVGKARRYADHVRREIEREIPTHEIRQAINNPPKPIADLQETLTEAKVALSKTGDDLNDVNDELQRDVSSSDKQSSLGADSTTDGDIASVEGSESETAAALADPEATDASLTTAPTDAPAETSPETENEPPVIQR
jgi:sec-independent protein translocase protein TatB